MPAADRSNKDKAMASAMKADGIERVNGRCPVCYGYMPNDTFGGSGAFAHMAQHARGYEAEKQKKIAASA